MKERVTAITFKQVGSKTPETEAQLEHRGVFIEGLTPYESAREFIDSKPEYIKEFAKREDVLHGRFWSELSETHETFIAIKQILEDLSEKAGLPKDFLKLSIFDSDNPDVHIQLLERKIRMSKHFLEIVGGDYRKITSVLAHEIGHILLAHYRSHKETTPDPLDERIQGYEHEYQADRASVILTNRMGIPPSTLANTLIDLERDLYSKNAKNEEIFPGVNHRSWVLSTHPHTSRRAMSINRDSVYLPHYPKNEAEDKIPLPKKGDFAKVDWRRWGAVANYDRLLLRYIDCLWEEIEVPNSLNDNFNTFYLQTTGGKSEKLFPKPEELIRCYKSKSKPVDFSPDEVAQWTEMNTKEIDDWWDQSMRVIEDKDGYDDLSEEIREYPPEVIKFILKRSCPEYSLIEDFSFSYATGDEIEDIDALKNFTKEILLTDKDNYYSSVELMLVTSLLIRTLFEKDESLQSVQGIQQFCQFLRDFKNQHGTYLACTGARYFIRIEELFNKAESDSGQDEIAKICKEYEEELKSGLNLTIPLVVTFMPNVKSYLENKYPQQIYNRNTQYKDIEKGTTTYQLPQEIRENADKEDLNQQEIRELITKIPKNFRPRNLSALLFSAMKEENERIDREGYSDMVLEADSNASANLLSGEEFEEKYFGSGRQSYIKAPYISLDTNIMEYRDALGLWDKSGYSLEFDAMESGINKVKFLLENFRVRSSMRDILISQSLNWSRIEYVEDIMNVQEDILKLEDVGLLFELSDVFSNPLLSLTVSQKLWELYENNPDNFFLRVPIEERERIKQELVDLPEDLKSQKLQAILLAYKEPTYVRDELLRPLVDSTPDQTTTMAIASYYCEPPPGVLRPRSGEVVAVTETLLDTLRGMPQLDKQELFLYFLGHRLFYSGIDSRFFADLRANEKNFRSDAIFLGENSFLKKYKLARAEDEGGWDSEESEERFVEIGRGKHSVDTKYLVESPDSLVFLIKASGVPVDLLLKQQRLTTTRREQRDFITHLLLGNEGVLTQGNKEEFLTAVARNVVDNSSWSKEQTDSEKKAMTDLLGFALNNCPNRKLPDLFLGLWNLQQEKGSLPEVMTTLLRELGSLFIKAGQYLGTQSNALPVEWIQAFRGLSDQNMRAEKTLVYEHEYALYGNDSPFERIGEKQGEGSMAAVYKGELKEGHSANGKEVAAKIFHPNIREELGEDAQFLDELVKFINSRKKEFTVRLPDNLADVSNNQILKELSYDNIVQNNKDIAEVLNNSKAGVKWKVPRVLEEVSKPEFIVYQYSNGIPLDKLPEEVRSSVRSDVAIELLRQILVEGTYQGDPNVGNFKAVVSENPKEKILVDWLDTDHTGKFTKEETKQLRRFIKEMAFGKNMKIISESLLSFVQSSVEVSSENLIEEIEKWLSGGKILEGSSVENLENIFISFLDFLADKKLVLKEQYVTLLRALGLMKPMLGDVKPSQYLSFFTKLMLTR